MHKGWDVLVPKGVVLCAVTKSICIGHEHSTNNKTTFLGQLADESIIGKVKSFE